ncbi:glycosyltransferase family 4 protein [Tundrisphaera sp. TA3]|uniref:glycosyltransferase family 4 protein n=1 Tax=Tundrisphaera sp. TA3 TaxID=3435775 RepID=UPI003EBA0D46
MTRRFPPAIGGAERILSYLARALAEAGAGVTVLTSHVPGLPASEGPDPHGVRVVRLPTSGIRFLGTWQYMRAMARWFARERVDLAYVSMLKHDAYVTIGAGRKHGFPVVLRPEGAGATGDLAWQRWGRFGSVIGRRCLTADAVVSISGAVRAELIAAGYDPGKIHDLPNGVPIPERPWTPSPGDAPIHAAFVGRLAPEKGLDVLIRAWPLVLLKRPEARLTLIGEGPERVGLEAEIARLGLGPHIALTGASDDPASILRHCDLFVLPSREEGMSIALLEAMALGLPLVASAIPGNRALVTDRVHGRLARPDDPEDLARAMLERWADPEGSMAMAEAARLRAIQQYSIAAVAERHLDLFRSVIADRAGGRDAGRAVADAKITDASRGREG